MRLAHGFAAALAVSVLVCACNRTKPQATSSEQVKPDFKLTAEQLLDDYRKNQIGADQKYKEKTLEITGKVAGIGKAPLLGYYVGLGSPHEGEFDIMCFLYRDDKTAEEKAGKLKEGDTVTIIGVCDGKAGGLALRIKHCYFP